MKVPPVSIPPLGKVAEEQLLQMEMANAAESIEKQYAAIRPQMEHLFRPLTKELKDAGLL